jgi:hypothetical protein
VVEYLLSKRKALNSNPNTAKKKKAGGPTQFRKNNKQVKIVQKIEN